MVCTEIDFRAIGKTNLNQKTSISWRLLDAVWSFIFHLKAGVCVFCGSVFTFPTKPAAVIEFGVDFITSDSIKLYNLNRSFSFSPINPIHLAPSFRAREVQVGYVCLCV